MKANTVKPQITGPAVYIFSHFNYIFCGPSQNSIWLMYYFPRFKGSPAFYIQNLNFCVCLYQVLALKGIFCMFQLTYAPLHSSRSSFIWNEMQNAQINKTGIIPVCGMQSDGICPFFIRPLHQLEVINVCYFHIVYACNSSFLDVI
jgi:hypothetical protein